MGIGRIRFIQDERGLWYWQYVDDELIVLAEGRKLVDNLEVCVMQAGIVTGLEITLSYGEEDFGTMKSMFTMREKPVGIEVRMYDGPVKPSGTVLLSAP